ncbi:hypothetical protein [Clostridium sp. AF32-12BH]|uniref:hypothetical protein n=1 Tax=Clostridium sp. AF32-12BH TaxID=2292006 RepID=UPI0015FCB88C|nr:hypothetical protein [Clostridium sp. AF32-12BH]
MGYNQFDCGLFRLPVFLFIGIIAYETKHPAHQGGCVLMRECGKINPARADFV